jgi:hypothetical protein
MTTVAGASTVVDRPQAGAPARRAEVVALSPNANVMHPHTVVPALTVTVPAGCHRLACAVGASDDAARVAPALAPSVEPALLTRLEEFAAREVPA